jgi:ribosome biogenesis GTPase / thiamine phosphate phosphatase
VDAYDAETMDYVEALVALYQQIGYPCLKISARTNEGIDKLRGLLKDDITLLSGNSGVGKSTLINLLVPEADLKTGAISSSHNKGMHTTTFSEMIELPEGGYIIDTPGIKGFGTIDMEREEIYHFFPDLFKYAENCRFHNCLHLQEPGCAVRQAVQEHHISESRYASYLSMLQDDIEEKYR